MKKVLFALLLVFFVLSACGNKKEEYKNNLQSSVDKMIETSIEAEGLIDNYAKVWNYTIKSKGAIPVASMAFTAGISEDDVKEHFPLNRANNIDKDFSTNINSLKSYYEDDGVIGELEKSLGEIKELISELKNPPEEFKEVYNETLDLYNLSDEFIRMAINPSGSLQDYNSDSKRLTSDLLNKKKRIDVVMPD